MITAVCDDDGEHVGFAKVTRDITERRRAPAGAGEAAAALAAANARLADANLQLRQAADDQAHFLAVTAHELRPPSVSWPAPPNCSSRHMATCCRRSETTELVQGMATASGAAAKAGRLTSSTAELAVHGCAIELRPSAWTCERT